MVRKVIFWAHLACGVTVGAVVVMMSATGVILTYERQLLAVAAEAHEVEVIGERLAIDALLDRVEVHDENFQPTQLTLSANPREPVEMRAGRSSTLLVDPYSATIIEPANAGLDAFFGVVTRWHRWFDAGGEQRDAARAVTGSSNLLFLFLLLSGAFLWLPARYVWPLLRDRLWFVRAHNSARRDLNWHHVFGAWALVPLIVIVTTGTVFGYRWANDLVYAIAGEAPPVRGGGTGAQTTGDAEAVQTLPLETLLGSAVKAFEARRGDWNRVTIELPAAGSAVVEFRFDQGNGGQPQHRHGLALHAESGELASWTPFSSLSAGSRLRAWVRFLHTGEALGVVGQTIAGLASLAAVLMVWTGIALSLRRFRRYRLRRQRRRAAAGKTTLEVQERLS